MERGQKIREIVSRLELTGLSDEEIAKVTESVDLDHEGLSRMTVWRIRRGEVTMPSSRTIRLLDLALIAIGERQAQELALARTQNGEQ